MLASLLITLALADATAPGTAPALAPAGPGVAVPSGRAGTPRAPPAVVAVPQPEEEAEPAGPPKVLESSMPGSPTTGKKRKRLRKRPRDPRHRILPLPHVSSQPATGLTLGGSLNYAFRLQNEEFNRVYLLAWSRVSTKLVQDHILSGRLRDVLGKKEIFQFGLWASLDPVFPFYGINNHVKIPGTELQDPRYWVRMDNYGGWFTYEHPLWRLHRPGRAVGTLRHYSGIFYYVDVIRGYDNSLLAVDYPEEQGVVRRGTLRGGLTWDSRDNDWSPREGSLIDVTVDAAGPFTLSTSNFGRLHASVRHYWKLGTSDVVLAHRVTFDGLWGEPPLMALGEFGGLFPVDAYGGAFAGRGFARRRFIGKFKATAGFELRFAPLEFKIRKHTLGLGLELFVEVGLVSMRLADLFKYWYPSGGPGILLIWDRFVVFRIEGGFGREGGALYLQSEHAF